MEDSHGDALSRGLGNSGGGRSDQYYPEIDEEGQYLMPQYHLQAYH